MKKTIYILSISFVMFLFSCGSENNNSQNDVDTENDATIVEVEDFDVFYEKFITDNVFQLERINFPLRGGAFDEMGEEKWEKDTWRPLTENINDIDKNEYTVKITETETSVKHVVELPNSGFSIDYTFEVIDEKWYLTEHNLYNY